ncbi:MAG: DUF4260 domain-containing protein [Cyclobacteriaceae bacterium]
MKTQLKLEQLAMLILSIYLFYLTDFDWWVYPALILIPDIGMIGYTYNPKIGAITYNITHHKGLGVLALLSGWHFEIPYLELAGIIWIGHACFDRVIGYGLKYPDNFKHTHLGWLNQVK